MFNLTPQERQVILFLISVAAVGIGADFLAKQFSPDRTIAFFAQDIGKVNLNNADKESLLSVPGIGEKTTQRIIEYREKNNGFTNTEQLKGIKGVSENKYGKIKDFFYVK